MTRIEGDKKVIAGLKRIKRGAKKVYAKVFGTWAKDAARDLKSQGYPPRRPGQTSPRTGALLGGFKAKRQGGLSWAIENTEDYSNFVVGPWQPWWHEGRWWLAKDVVRESVPELSVRVKDELIELYD